MANASSLHFALTACAVLAWCGCGRKGPSGDDAAGVPLSATERAGAQPTASGYGKVGDPIHLSVGYQPYYSEAWSGVVVNGLGLWKKYLPAGSTVEFNLGLQGAIIVNAMLAGKEEIGYLGDMPAIVGATKRNVADLRIVANIGLSHDQCNVFLVSPDAPSFKDANDAIRWFDGKTVGVPRGSCADRFAAAVFKKQRIVPKEYLNQSIELITSGFRVKKLAAAVVWEPVASRLVSEGLARRAATGNDFGEADGAFIDMRADLMEQRPDVVKAWLEAELDAELYLADPNNSHEVARLAKEQTTGLDEPTLWRALFGAYPASEGGSATRLSLPFGFTSESQELLTRATAFLFEVKSIATPELPADAVLRRFTDEILKERALRAPVAQIRASQATAAK
jgi:NitT/TauT family transport system substrate-binding protein